MEDEDWKMIAGYTQETKLYTNIRTECLNTNPSKHKKFQDAEKWQSYLFSFHSSPVANIDGPAYFAEGEAPKERHQKQKTYSVIRCYCI